MTGHLEPDRPRLITQGRASRPGRTFKPDEGLNVAVLRAIATREADGVASWLTALSQQLGRNTGQMNPTLARLEREGYVTRRPDPTMDGRVLVELTDRARELLARVGVRA
jgi:DNA-binding MarR family transcriptional regulator